MRRGAPMKRTPMRRKPRRRPTMTPEQYDVVMMRARGRCEAQIAPDCHRGPEVWHHRQSRAVGDHSAPNGLALCDPCHRHVHAHPEESRELGLIVSRHHPDPIDVPVRMWDGWWHLTDGGSRVEVES